MDGAVMLIDSCVRAGLGERLGAVVGVRCCLLDLYGGVCLIVSDVCFEERVCTRLLSSLAFLRGAFLEHQLRCVLCALVCMGQTYCACDFVV